MSSAHPPPVQEPPAWRAAFRHRDFRLFQTARLLSILGMQMQSVAIAWQIYAVTGRPLDLAWVGLAQFLPAAGLSLVTGHAADRFDRRRILLICHSVMAFLSVGLLLVARDGGRGVGPIYAVLVGVGVARAFLGPANQSTLPALVPVEHFGNAVAWSSSLWQSATVVGPMLGGLVYGTAGASTVYAAAAGTSAAAALLVGGMRKAQPVGRVRKAPPTRASVLAGVRYVRRNPIVLGAISLDLFAVLLGGATALLPIYARDILGLGPFALGVLRSAPGAGAAVTGVALAVVPIERRAGSKMLGCVALFGVATVVFGLSRSFALSLAALTVAGAADMISVFVRSALVQLATPEEMRGRVSAVNMVFIGASNELGEFESGVTAQWLGAVPAVVLGGLGTLAVVAIWAWLFSQAAKGRPHHRSGARLGVSARVAPGLRGRYASVLDPMADITTFDDFWPHYVHAHRHPVNRALHYVGTTAALGAVAAAAVTLNPAWLLVAPVAGYGPAWIGHFVFERNKPATFEHPLWSLRGDLKMYSLAVRGKMAAEVERICGAGLPAGHTHQDHLAQANGVNGVAAAPSA